MPTTILALKAESGEAPGYALGFGMKLPPGQTAVLVARNDRLSVGKSLGRIANSLVDGRFK